MMPRLSKSPCLPNLNDDNCWHLYGSLSVEWWPLLQAFWSMKATRRWQVVSTSC